MSRRTVNSRRIVGPETFSRRRLMYLRRVSVEMLAAFLPLKNSSKWDSCGFSENSLDGLSFRYFLRRSSYLRRSVSEGRMTPRSTFPRASSSCLS
jgi:hypothetical protein